MKKYVPNGKHTFNLNNKLRWTHCQYALATVRFLKKTFFQNIVKVTSNLFLDKHKT